MTEQTGNNKPNEAEGLAFLLSGNEKLIEEAAKRLLKDVNPKHGRPASSQLASDIRLVAGAVFERALTPTDDEREALADRLARRLIDDPEQLMLAEGTGALHVALSESIRSTIEDVYADCGDSDPGVLSSNIARRLAWDLPPAILSAVGFRRSEVPEPSAEPQGEPSEGVIRNHGGWDMGLQSKSYPPDSAVDAALTAWNVTGGSDRVAMRAALRAAGVVGQEGESRG